MVNYAYLKKLKQNGNLPVEATYFRFKNGDIRRYERDRIFAVKSQFSN